MIQSVIRDDFSEAAIDITFMIINKCNYNCKYCIEKIPQQQIETKFLDLKQMEIFVNKYLKIYPNNIVYIRIYGGEPTLHPDLLSFCENLNIIQNVKIIEIFTNFSATYNLYYNLLKIDKVHLFTSYHSNKLMTTSEYLNKIYKLNCNPEFDNKIIYNIMLENINESNENNTYSLYKKLLKIKKQQNFKARIELIPLFSTKYYKSVYNKYYLKLFNIINKLNNLKMKFILTDFNGKQLIQHKVCGCDSYNFSGWKCSSGKNAIFIDPYGYIYPCGGLYTKRNEFKNNFKKNIFDYMENIQSIFDYTICPHSDCVLCVPMKVENINKTNFNIDYINSKYSIE